MDNRVEDDTKVDDLADRIVDLLEHSTPVAARPNVQAVPRSSLPHTQLLPSQPQPKPGLDPDPTPQSQLQPEAELQSQPQFQSPQYPKAKKSKAKQHCTIQ